MLLSNINLSLANGLQFTPFKNVSILLMVYLFNLVAGVLGILMFVVNSLNSLFVLLLAAILSMSFVILIEYLV
jgi:hypothetical protein